MPSLLASRRAPYVVAAVTALVALVAIGVVLVLGGRPGPFAEQSDRPERPVPEDFEPPPPEPVEGETRSTVVDLSHDGARLFGPSRSESDPIPVDEGAVETHVGLVADWLDRHLTDLQEGGRGGVPDADLTGPAESLTLTHPDAPVETARYHAVVYVRGTPEWLRVGVTVTRNDGSTQRANMVFLPGDPPHLVGGQGEGSRPPAGGSGTDQNGSPEDAVGDDPATAADDPGATS